MMSLLNEWRIKWGRKRNENITPLQNVRNTSGKTASKLRRGGYRHMKEKTLLKDTLSGLALIKYVL